MLSKFRVQHYKSLFDTEIDLEPLIVFIGSNGSGKSNICEVLAVLSDFLQRLMDNKKGKQIIFPFFSESLKAVSKNQQSIESKFWHGKLDYLLFEASTNNTIKSTDHEDNQDFLDILITLNYPHKTVTIANKKRTLYRERNSTPELRELLVDCKFPDSPIGHSLKKINIYDFAPSSIASKATSNGYMEKTGEGIAYALLDILLANREGFDELQERLTLLVPNIKKIVLPRSENNTFSLELVDKYSEHHIPAADISDGTLRILAFLTALYQENTPSIICFEEIENGVHPWLLHKMMELLKIVSTEGITGNPVQVLITTHSPVLLNYVEPHQVRAVELDKEGKTQVHKLPLESVRFQKALEAYDGALGELWFTNVFGGNPT
ncbi:AAA family ATPase [Sphaerospermopsis sp. LEGE 08334]|uniref:AAA family ATPase n=1 Tax=Sphaerospermopsis sp. LEGE 08334 TaxID=1828651 RepID=UPI00187FE587|nr:ATP-binding protein [Sphaerospermopsis sp. LEGE 08334]MBE9054721.1 AAA family ATPase [Sphaerospermopsis sp. LEGE 08334]